jgi:hypothetical protein
VRVGGFPVRESDVLVGATFPAKKGQVYFGRFYLGKRRTPAMICSHLSRGNRRRFRKYIARFNRQFNSKEAASPSRKRPQILRIDDGKGYFCFGLSC